MTPEELVTQAAERDAVKASQRLETIAAKQSNTAFYRQDREPFGTLPSREQITTGTAPDPFEGLDIGGAA